MNRILSLDWRLGGLCGLIRRPLRRGCKTAGAMVLAAFALLNGCTPLETGDLLSPPGTTTTIIMVRHAERDEGFDPPLNAEGLVRAVALADELEDAGVTAIFFPDFVRNHQTADPLVARGNPLLRVYTQLEAADTKALANSFVDEVLAEHAGGVVLWIGNTGPAIEGVQEGNLQEIFARLGGTGNAPVRYQDLFTIVIHDDRPPTITKGTYGGPSSLD